MLVVIFVGKFLEYLVFFFFGVCREIVFLEVVFGMALDVCELGRRVFWGVGSRKEGRKRLSEDVVLVGG